MRPHMLQIRPRRCCLSVCVHTTCRRLIVNFCTRPLRGTFHSWSQRRTAYLESSRCRLRDSHRSTGTHTTCCSLKQQQNTHRLCPLSGTTRVSRYQKGYLTNLDFTEARDSEWQWNQLAICKSAPHSRQITMPALHHSVFLQAGCPSCRPTNSVKALKACRSLINVYSRHLFWGRGFPPLPPKYSSP